MSIMIFPFWGDYRRRQVRSGLPPEGGSRFRALLRFLAKLFSLWHSFRFRLRPVRARPRLIGPQWSLNDHAAVSGMFVSGEQARRRQRRKIAERYASGETRAELARAYKVSEPTVWRVTSGAAS